MKTKIMILALAAMSSASAMAQDVKYFKDIAIIKGVPTGLFEVKKDMVKDRLSTFKFMYQNGKVDSVAKVTSRETLSYLPNSYNHRYTAIKVNYAQDGNVDYLLVKNSGNQTFVLDYDKSLTTVTALTPDMKTERLEVLALYPAPEIIAEGVDVSTKKKLTYDSKGLVIKEEPLNKQGKTVWPVFEYKYNSSNQLAEIKAVTANGAVSRYFGSDAYLKFYYDANGDETKSQFCGVDGKVSSESSSVYDADMVKEYRSKENTPENYVMEGDVYNADGTPNKCGNWTITYSDMYPVKFENGAVDSEGEGSDAFAKVEFEFDKVSCRPTTAKYYDEKGKLAKTETYKYDSNYRLVKRWAANDDWEENDYASGKSTKAYKQGGIAMKEVNTENNDEHVTEYFSLDGKPVTMEGTPDKEGFHKMVSGKEGVKMYNVDGKLIEY